MELQKILVTTDFSYKSKSGLRFAIQLALKHSFDLTFFHAYNIMIPTSWSDESAKDYRDAEEKKIWNEMNLCVDRVYKGMGLASENKKCVIKSSVFPQSCIMEYAFQNDFSFICMSTKGAGKFEKFFGTNTANLIIHSDVPVIAVPHNYKVHPIKSILYASDLLNLEKELIKVVDFAKLLSLEVELLHFTSPLELMMDSKVIEVAVDKFSDYEVKLNIKKRNIVKTLINDIESAIAKEKPSLMVMFTEQNRNLFQRIFLSSKSAEYSFKAKIPLLVFNKS